MCGAGGEEPGEKGQSWGLRETPPHLFSPPSRPRIDAAPTHTRTTPSLLRASSPGTGPQMNLLWKGQCVGGWGGPWAPSSEKVGEGRENREGTSHLDCRGQECGVAGGEALSSPPDTHPRERPRLVPWPRFPLQAKGLSLPQMPGCKEGLGVAPPRRLKIIVILTALWKPGKGRRYMKKN